MKRLAAILVTAVLSLCVAAAGCNSRPDQPAPPRVTGLFGPTMAPTTSPATVPVTAAAPEPPATPRATLAYLASDALEGRGIGTKGLDKAASYIAAEFQRTGLQPPPGGNGYFQPFEMTTTTEVGPKTALRVDDRSYKADDDFTPVGASASGAFEGGVAFAGYGMKSDAHRYDDYAGLDAKGKVVVVMRYEPHDEKGQSRFDPHGWSEAAAIVNKAQLAQEHGAVALLLVTPPMHHDNEPLLGVAQGGRRAEDKGIPVLHIQAKIAEDILRRAGQADGLKTLQGRIDREIKPASLALAGVTVSGEVDLVRKKVPVKNVIGILPGQTDEYIVVGAHYDHLGRGGASSLGGRGRREIHNGADDNASGTTAMLMLASRFASGPTPQRGIIFAAFTGEEEGLIGSGQFVKQPAVPLSKIVAMINLDMVGRIGPPRSTTAPATRAVATTRAAKTVAATVPATQPTGDVVYVGGSGTAGGFAGVVQKADARSPLQVREVGRGGLGPSDHMSFALKKIPVLFLFSGLHADYHRPSDDADKISYEGINRVVDFAADLIEQIDATPRQAYVDAADASSMHMGMPGMQREGRGGGPRVSLGVVPDYSAVDEGGGVRIGGTSPGSPAAGAGMKGGDLLVKFDGRQLDTLYDLTDALARSKPGQKVKVQVLRGKETIDFEVTLVERKG